MKKVLLGTAVLMALLTGCTEEKKPAATTETKTETPAAEVKAPAAEEKAKTEEATPATEEKAATTTTENK
ncbi:hypothetical protein [Aliarcobacter butzleri]|uniref:hypothetical protein n=1 Tax=Aliarcobacter butzleri TaxID=28197 RepID=UPI0021B34ACC|nr:hypothetical protein [Aliarcobacter butzleri]MCT7554763.1 hypothetical protein [Aliarcobacter butzleri]